MSDIINQTGAVIEKSAELLKNPALTESVTGLYSWLGDILKKPSAKDKLEIVRQNKHNGEIISGLMANLEFLLEGNEALQNQLTEKLKEIDLLMKQAGVSPITKTNEIILTSIGDIEICSGNINPLIHFE